jgi:hypothetical protein
MPHFIKKKLGVKMREKLKVAVLVEVHPFDIMNFQNMLWSFDDCECYVQPADLFVQDNENNGKYDVVLYYCMNLPTPAEDSFLRKYIEEKLGSTNQGILLLHHALLSFPNWDFWDDVSGMKIRCVDGIFEFHQNEIVKYQLLDIDHPILSDIEPCTIKDETYIMGEPVVGDNDILIQTANTNSIKNIAWTRKYKNSRVFCYASGHDNTTYSSEDFRRILHNGILWCANLK